MIKKKEESPKQHQFPRRPIASKKNSKGSIHDWLIFSYTYNDTSNHHTYLGVGFQ